MPMPTPVVSHDQKSHVTPYFNCLDLRNAMVPMITLLASGGSGATDQKSHATAHFDCY